MPWLLTTDIITGSSSMGLMLMSWNVRGLNNVVKRKKVLTFIKSKRCDIVFMQETHLLLQESKKLCKDWVGFVGAACGSSNSRGVATLISKHLQFKCLKESKDDEGRILLILSEIQGNTVILANVYAPNVDDPSFFGILERMLGEMGDYPVLLGSDMNEVMDSVLDRSSTLVRSSRAQVALKDMTKEMGLIDVWRMQNPTARDYSYFSPRYGSLSRIDYLLVSQSLMSSVLSTEIGNRIISDHSPIYLKITSISKPERSTRWRFNSSLLMDETFKESLRAQISLYIETNLPTAPSAGIAWEALKAFLRGHIIQHASFKKKENVAKLRELENKIGIAEENFKVNTSPENLNILTKLKYDFNVIITQKAEFALFRARQKYFEEGDKAGRLLARYIKQREAMSAIPAIRDSEGRLISDPKRINSAFRGFYNHLYTSESIAEQEEITSFLADLDLPKLSMNQIKRLDLPITVGEIMEVIKLLPTSKAPGLDGFTAEFYKAYSEELAPLLLNMYNEALKEGTLPPSLTEAVITLIPKDGRDPLDCKNYRPISLTSCDSKILSKILANRLDSVITSLIHEDQVGFIHSRSSSDNIRRLVDIMWASQDDDPDSAPLAAISLDAEKAFDRLEWRYLFSTLECFGFSKKFIDWIRLIYTRPIASVLTNGIISSPFQLGRGTRQGDPASPLLFAIALEPLAAAIRKDQAFPGITIDNKCHKLMLYADDILLFVSDPEHSLPSLFDTIDRFSSISGYKVNWSKSEALPLTSHCPRSLFQTGSFEWPAKGIKYLGIIFPSKLDELVKINFEPLLDKIRTDVERWSSLFLSMWGKANIIKMNCAPRLNYLLQALPVKIPLHYFKQFDQICNKFLWNNKRPRMSLKKLQRPVDRGGLGIPSLLLYHYAFTMRHMVQWTLPPERAPPWFSLESALCAPLTPIECLTTKLDSISLSHPIMSHIHWVWRKIARMFEFNPLLHWSAGIWDNPKLCIGRKPFLWDPWYQRGIKILGHLYHDNNLKSFEELKTEFGLPHTCFWQYLQLRHLLTKTFGSPTSPPPKIDTVETFFKIFGMGHEASAYYTMLLDASDQGTFASKLPWEKDLGLTFSDGAWAKILRNGKKMSRELRTRLIQFKIVNRVYWTPSRLFRVGLTEGPECWKCQDSDGTLIHMLWACPKIQDYWTAIHERLERVAGLRIPFSPSLFILGDPATLKNVAPPLAEWIQTAIMSGRRLLAKEWKAPSAPAPALWEASMGQLAAYERLSYRLLDRMDDYDAKWGYYHMHESGL